MNKKYRLVPAKDCPIRKMFEIEKPDGTSNQFNMKCPNLEGHYRGDLKPSLSVNLDKMVFHCFGCDYQGKVILSNKEGLMKVNQKSNESTEKRKFCNPETAKQNSTNILSFLEMKSIKRTPVLRTLSDPHRKLLADKGHNYSEQTIREFYLYSDGPNTIRYRFQGCTRYIDTTGKIGNFKWIGDKDSKNQLIGDFSQHHALIFEGEHDMFMAYHLGLKGYCTFTAGAMSIPEDSELEKLRGKNVVIVYDMDEPGRNGAKKLCDKLVGIVKKIRNVELPLTGEKDDKDFTDWVNQGGTEEDFERIVKETPKCFAIKYYGAHEFMKLEIPQRELIIDPWLADNSYIFLAGERGVGKSYFCLTLARSIARGEDFAHWKTLKPERVLYIDGEMSDTDPQERFKFMGINEKDDKNLKIISNANLIRLGQEPINLTKEKSREKLIHHIINDIKPKVVILDNLSSLAPGVEENPAHEYALINQFCLELRAKGIACIVVHHVGKSGDQRGTSAHEDNVDLSIKLIKPQDYKPSDGARFIVKFVKTRFISEFTKLENKEFKLIRKMTHKSKGYLDWEVRGIGIEAEIEILKILAEWDWAKGKLTQKIIEKKLGKSQGGFVSPHIKELRTKGLVEQKGLKVTDKGMKKYNEIISE